MRPGDLLCLICAASLTAFSIVRIAGHKEGTALLIINRDDEEWAYPLNRDGDYRISGPLGVSLIRVSSGRAFFVESPCLNKICIASPALSRSGDWAGCLPNHVLIRIENTAQEQPLDAVSF